MKTVNRLIMPCDPTGRIVPLPSPSSTRCFAWAACWAARPGFLGSRRGAAPSNWASLWRVRPKYFRLSSPVFFSACARFRDISCIKTPEASSPFRDSKGMVQGILPLQNTPHGRGHRKSVVRGMLRAHGLIIGFWGIVLTVSAQLPQVRSSSTSSATSSLTGPLSWAFGSEISPSSDVGRSVNV